MGSCKYSKEISKLQKTTDGYSVICFVMLIFSLMFFIVVSVIVYETNKKIDSLEKTTKFNLDFIEDFVMENREKSVQNFSVLNQVGNNVETITERISVIEASIDPQDKRWASIKQIRKAILEEANTQLGIKDFTNMATAIFDYSEEHDLPVSLILAVIETESEFNPRAKSAVGALGLMQIMPPTADDISLEIGHRKYNLYNIRNNIQFGTMYLWKLISRFNGNVDLAVRAYNCGPQYVEKVVAGIYRDYPEETKGYIVKVKNNQKKFIDKGL